MNKIDPVRVFIEDVVQICKTTGINFPVINLSAICFFCKLKTSQCHINNHSVMLAVIQHNTVMIDIR